jgi:hypothetical protein
MTMKFVSDLRQIGGCLRIVRCPPSIKLTATSINKTNRHDTTGILLKVALNTTPKKKRKEKETTNQQ